MLQVFVFFLALPGAILVSYVASAELVPRPWRETLILCVRSKCHSKLVEGLLLLSLPLLTAAVEVARLELVGHANVHRGAPSGAPPWLGVKSICICTGYPLVLPCRPHFLGRSPVIVEQGPRFVPRQQQPPLREGFERLVVGWHTLLFFYLAACIERVLCFDVVACGCMIIVGIGRAVVRILCL